MQATDFLNKYLQHLLKRENDDGVVLWCMRVLSASARKEWSEWSPLLAYRSHSSTKRLECSSGVEVKKTEIGFTRHLEPLMGISYLPPIFQYDNATSSCV